MGCKVTGVDKGLRVEVLGCRDKDLGHRFQGLGCKVWSGTRTPCDQLVGQLREDRNRVVVALLLLEGCVFL